MTELTKEQLIEEAKLKIAIAKCHPNSGMARVEGELFKIALASLEAEPVAYMWDSERKDIDAPGYYRPEHLVFAESNVKQWGGRVVPLYTAPHTPVVPDEIEPDDSNTFDYVDGWNACREAMLQDNRGK
ncbi:hypothetical protein [Escherichia whittamii]|uniref:hypothetical protein n=1 Tax=Escherichia whittamii TaxID=2762229 RepID=UPI002E2283B2|nr:hypothetical protein [Escherichia whittamii]MEC9562625.1 hypothetical protein [Escherichia whittamii]